MRTTLTISFLFCFTTGVLVADTDFAGLFQGESTTLEMQKVGDDKYEGVVTEEKNVLHFTAQLKGDALVGTMSDGGEKHEFRITLKGKTLTLTADGETQTLTREGTPAAPPAPAPQDKPVVPPKASPALRVNGVVIDEATVQKFEQEHHQMIPRGDFWYDKISGAWGIDGGPTVGFTTPGMDLGGPLRADASHGDTGVFINGRELPWPDVQGLQSMNVPVERGRWIVDNAGNFAAEGETMPRGNLFQFSRGKGGAYQRSTAGGYIGGDGQTSYFFDPKSGSSVMVGD